MVKKIKKISLLTILIIICFGTICYAYSVNEDFKMDYHWQIDDLKSYAFNFYTNYYHYTDKKANQLINGYDWSQLNTYINTNWNYTRCFYFIYISWNTIAIMQEYNYDSPSRGYIYNNGLTDKKYVKGILLAENSISNTSVSSNNMIFYANYFFTQNDIYTNGGTTGNNPILYPQGSYGASYTFNYNEYNPEPILDWWAFSQDSNQQRSININGTETTIYFDNLLPVDNSIGWNIDSEQTDKITMRVSYYNTVKQEWEQLKKYTIFNSSNQDIKDVFPYYESNIDSSLIDSNIVLRLQDYTIEDTILDFEFIRKVSGDLQESDFLNYTTYLVGDNTAITTTEINVAQTFSGEYARTYNNNLNNFINDPNNEYNKEQNQVDLNSNFDNVIQAIESGERKAEQRFDFWKNTYNGLFTIPSGEVEEKIRNFYENINLGDSGEAIGIITQAVNTLKGEPQDFVISWNDIVIPNLKQNQQIKIIDQGNINFSQYCRDNEALNQLKTWVNIIAGLSMLILFIIKFHALIHRLLGTENEFIDTTDEEIVVGEVAEDNTPVPYMQGAYFKDQVWRYGFANGSRKRWTWGK